MNIIQVLMTQSIHISNGRRMMYYNDITGEWMVIENKGRSRKVLASTIHEDEAVAALIED